MQAIVTKFHGPTNSRGSRVSAKCAAGRIMLDWDPRMGSEGNHNAAAVALARKLGWNDGRADLHGGSLPDNSGNVYVFAFTGDRADLSRVAL